MVDLICCLLLCPRLQSDRLVWVGTTNCEFLVKIACHLAQATLDSSKRSNSTMELGSKNWRKVWKVKGPRVVRYFMWKACNEILPIKGNLYRRGITSDARCRICELEVEIVGHSL
jgi:hypothetical protein